MTRTWTCPVCDRTFRRANQRHACGLGDRDALLSNKSPTLVRLFEEPEATVGKLDPVEIVTRDRYVLFRTTRIFADMTFMWDALRLVVHLDRQVDDRRFFKVVASAEEES